MIKFTATGDGITIIGLAITEENVTRLRAGQAIRVRLADLGFTGAAGTMQICIYYGKDEAALREALAPFLGPETVIRK